MELPKLENDDIVQSQNDKENVIEIEIPYPIFQYLNSEECNVHNICRICLAVNEPELYSLFSCKEQSVLANIFVAVSEVQISPEDGLPPNICTKCQMDVLNYYEFKMKCIKSDYTLKSILKREFVIDDRIANNINTQSTADNPELNTYKEQVVESVKDLNEEQGNDYFEELKTEDNTLCLVQDIASNQKVFSVINSDKTPSYETTKNRRKGSHKKKEKHQCTLCSKKFHKSKSLSDHMSKQHASAECAAFPCAQCRDSFDSEHDLAIHGILHDQGPLWKCTRCQKDFNGRTALRRHIERHMQRRKFACTRCSATFVERYALRRHSRVHTGQAEEKKHKCTQCDKSFSWRGLLAAHMSVHGAARGCVCGECGAAFASRRLLASHLRVHSDDKPYRCTHCDKRFRHESTRNTHVRTHTGERPYVCAQCGKTFIQHSNMTLHMRTHTGERPYACTMCERKFSSSSTLKTHMHTHTGERPYSCKICGKSFSRVSLRSHMRMHSGERSHRCPAPNCCKLFATGHRLKEHYRRHTGERPYECADCPAKYTTKNELIRHIKKHELKKKQSKKGVLLTPITVSDKHRSSNQADTPKQLVFLDMTKQATTNQGNFCTVHETTMENSDGVKCNDDDIKTEVIVLDSNPNLMTDGVSYVNDVNLVTVNEGEVSISAASSTIDGASVKLYQYDQSLLQIHTGGGQLTISRISSKMTNF